MTLRLAHPESALLRLVKWPGLPSHFLPLHCAVRGLSCTEAVEAAFRTQSSSTPSRRSGHWPPVANSALIPSKLRSPTWKPLGNAKTYLVADSSLSRKQLPGGKNVFYNK